MKDKILCILYFDKIIGPSFLHGNLDLSNGNKYPDLRKILDYNEGEGTLFVATPDFASFNYIFVIKSHLARGGVHSLMISFIIEFNYYNDNIKDCFKEMYVIDPILRNFAEEIKHLNFFNKLLDKNIDNDLKQKELNYACNEIRNNFLNLYDKYLRMLS